MKKSFSLFLALALFLCLIPAGAGLALGEEILPPNTPLTSRLSSRSDAKTFLLQLPESGSLELSFRFVPGGEYYVTLFEMKSDGTLDQLQKTYFYFRGETVTGTVTRATDKLRLPAGDYYVKVAPYSSSGYSNEDFTLTARYEEEPESSFEKEFDDSAVKAMKLRANRPVTGNLNNSSDQDFYSFELAESSSVQLSLRFDPAGEYYVILSGIDEGGGLQQIQKTYFYTNTSSETGFVIRRAEKLRLPVGLYFVKVCSYSSSSYFNGDYTLTVNAEEESEDTFEKEFNDTGATATPIETQVEIIGNLASVDTEDYFRFRLLSPASVRIRFRFVPGEEYSVSVFRPEEDGTLTRVQKTYFYHSGEASTETVIKFSDPLELSAGEYYLLVAPYNSYSVCNDDYGLTVLH